jgi:endonuclease YncB( thermonuclease family)
VTRLALALLLFAALPAQAQPFRCAVEHTSDGDTLRCHGGPVVRLGGVDAPERSQPGGVEAWVALRALIQARILDCVRVATDRYGRAVATCAHPMVPGDVGAAMVLAGHAWDYVAYSRGRYADLQEMARADRVGVWATPGAIEPWRWRKGER